jgi:pimeloyl-ACP methyl ester carboxylesterase
VLPIVLVHGGGFDGRCWEPLLPHLDGPALAIDLPGRGIHPAPLGEVTFAACAEAVRGDVDAAGFDDIVLVGHSLAGCSMPSIVDLLGARVRHAVFVACTVPDDGRGAFDMLDPNIQQMIRGAGGLRSCPPANSAVRRCTEPPERQLADPPYQFGAGALHRTTRTPTCRSVDTGALRAGHEAGLGEVDAVELVDLQRAQRQRRVDGDHGAKATSERIAVAMWLRGVL